MAPCSAVWVAGRCAPRTDWCFQHGHPAGRGPRWPSAFSHQRPSRLPRVTASTSMSSSAAAARRRSVWALTCLGSSTTPVESSGAPTKSPPPRSTQRGLRCPSTTPSVPGSPLHIFTQTLPPYHPLPHEMWSFARPPPCNVASAKKMLPFLRFQEPGGARYPRFGSLLGSFGVSLPPSLPRSVSRPPDSAPGTPIHPPPAVCGRADATTTTPPDAVATRAAPRRQGPRAFSMSSLNACN